MKSQFSWFNATSIALGFAFLYIPILLLVIYSFNESKLVTVWGGWSTKWYASVFENESIMNAAWVTLRVALVSATIATILGTLAAIVLVRFGRFKGQTVFSGLIFAPLVMPEVITGLSLLLLFVAIGLDRGFWTVVIAHITFAMCFAAVVVQSRLLDFDKSVEEAAMDLGATPVNTFFQVTLPIIAPAVISAWLLAFTLSLDDLVIASFATGPRRHHAADEDLQPGTPRRDARNQCHLDVDDRIRDGWRPCRLDHDQTLGVAPEGRDPQG
jgi:putrescine transport system permease protein